MMIRMDDQMARDLKTAARANDLTISDIVRLAVREQMPAIRSGKTKLQPS
jgi:hypothetical protein